MALLANTVVPAYVPQIFVNFYPIAIVVAIIIAVIGLSGVILEKNDFQKMLIIQIPILAMYLIVSAVGTDLAEALILPGMVVSLAEILAVSEILVSRELTKRVDRGESPRVMKFEYPTIQMEVLKTALPITSMVFVVYGVILTGFTGGAVAGAGILIYIFVGNVAGFSHKFWEDMAGISGVAYIFWLLGFLIFFLAPQYWLIALFMAGGGITVKVALKLGLLGVLGREEYNR
jgi:energy-converting hydrogenase A subunit G